MPGAASARPSWFVPALSATLCGLLFAGSFWMLVEARRYYSATARLHQKMFGAPVPDPSKDPEANAIPPPEDLEAEFDQVVRFLREHPDRKPEALRRFRDLEIRAEGTPVAQMSEDAIRRLRQER